MRELFTYKSGNRSSDRRLSVSSAYDKAHLLIVGQGDIMLSAEDARRLANDLLAMFPEPEYRILAPHVDGFWQVVWTEMEDWVADFNSESDAKAFCDMKNAEVQS